MLWDLSQAQRRGPCTSYVQVVGKGTAEKLLVLHIKQRRVCCSGNPLPVDHTHM